MGHRCPRLGLRRWWWASARPPVGEGRTRASEGQTLVGGGQTTPLPFREDTSVPDPRGRGSNASARPWAGIAAQYTASQTPTSQARADDRLHAPRIMECRPLATRLSRRKLSLGCILCQLFMRFWQPNGSGRPLRFLHGAWCHPRHAESSRYRVDPPYVFCMAIVAMFATRGLLRRTSSRACHCRWITAIVTMFATKQGVCCVGPA